MSINLPSSGKAHSLRVSIKFFFFHSAHHSERKLCPHDIWWTHFCLDHLDNLHTVIFWIRWQTYLKQISETPIVALIECRLLVWYEVLWRSMVVKTFTVLYKRILALESWYQQLEFYYMCISHTILIIPLLRQGWGWKGRLCQTRADLTVFLYCRLFQWWPLHLLRRCCHSKGFGCNHYLRFFAL